MSNVNAWFKELDAQPQTQFLTNADKVLRNPQQDKLALGNTRQQLLEFISKRLQVLKRIHAPDANIDIKTLIDSKANIVATLDNLREALLRYIMLRFDDFIEKGDVEELRKLFVESLGVMTTLGQNIVADPRLQQRPPQTSQP